ncbi:Transmembrane protein OS=Streptomyces alboniger OX=132473 GN=CP975_17425 PE=4 SV=1 [Streptomyces alboniger]
MSDPSGLRPEHRADFEAVLHLALNTPDIRSALSADPAGLAARRLRVRALADAEEIAAPAQDEYRAYLACLDQDTPATEVERAGTRQPAEDSRPRQRAEGSGPRRDAEAGPLPTSAVLTPLMASTSAVALLVLGHLLQLADVHGTLPGSLTTAGWVLALLAAVSTLVALAAVMGTVVRGRTGSARCARRERTWLDWRQALLEHGMLPHLRRCLAEDPSLRASRPGQPRTRD